MIGGCYSDRRFGGSLTFCVIGPLQKFALTPMCKPERELRFKFGISMIGKPASIVAEQSMPLLTKSKEAVVRRYDINAGLSLEIL